MDINCVNKCEYQTDGKCQLHELQEKDINSNNPKKYECINLI